MTITPKQYARAWYELMQDKKTAKDASKKMLSHLHKNGRLSMLPEILRQMEDIERQASGIEQVTITSARELDANFVKKIVQNLLKTKEARIAQKIDPDLIGGVRVETKNKRWDLSIRSKLKLLEKALTH